MEKKKCLHVIAARPSKLMRNYSRTLKVNMEGKFYLRKNKELLYFNISNIYLLILFLK